MMLTEGATRLSAKIGCPDGGEDRRLTRGRPSVLAFKSSLFSTYFTFLTETARLYQKELSLTSWLEYLTSFIRGIACGVAPSVVRLPIYGFMYSTSSAIDCLIDLSLVL